MKIYSKEYCQCCNSHILFEFEDTDQGEQEVICPICKTKHHRRLDSSSIIQMRNNEFRTYRPV